MWSERSAETNATSRGNAHGVSDESLVEAAKRGHSTAFDTLSERYRQQLFCVARRITRSSEDAEDAVQDTLLRAFVHMGDFDGRSKLGTWLTRIAINSALMILRKKRASREIASDCNDDFCADGLHEITDHQPNPEKRYAQNEEESMLRKAIRRLRPTLRVVVQIQQLQERSMQETAEAIGISLAAAKGRLFHARNALRRSIIPKLVHQPRFAGGIRFLPAGQGLTGKIAGLNEESILKGKTPRQGMMQPLRFQGAEFPRDSWRRANARTRFDDQQQSNGKEEGHEYVIETKEKRKCRVPSKLHPSRDGRGFSRELGAWRGNQTSRIRNLSRTRRTTRP
jgi:RNA polymerase sigma factor (sigma-70 family)